MKLFFLDCNTGNRTEMKGLKLLEIPFEFLSFEDQKRVRLIQSNMDKAIEEERYEIAAICRDEIKKIKTPKC